MVALAGPDVFKRKVEALVNKFSCTVILKGQHSLIAGQNQAGELIIYRCLDGNPGMATGGMGDILSGVTGAVLAQFIALGLSPLAAAKLACCVHSKAADYASVEGEIGLRATDLLPFIRRIIQTQSGSGDEMAEHPLEHPLEETEQGSSKDD